MWLLTHDEGGPGGDVFKGKKIWLRPGKKYLFGRTMKETGQIVIQDSQVSRKHLTIEIAHVPEGEGTDPKSRAKVTVQDLDTKLGSWVNGKSINGERFDLIKDDNEIKLGKQGTVLRIRWHPVVFSFSFSKAEIEQGDAVLTTVRQTLEPLDIKYVTDGRPTGFTHLVSKKRNNSKVLQALINGQLIVSQAFADAVARAAVPTTDQNGIETSPLEEDFEGNWPDATKFVPAGPDGADEAFAPDERRREIFDGYTFIFYDKRYTSLHPVITAGKGKALFREVVPEQTDVNDFVRYVKSVAGEKGLGEFEDGSEGKGVVVVRYTPPGDGPEETWYKHFFNEFALRLDHRPIEIRELLFAVLDVDHAQLRRPLLLEPTPRESATQNQDTAAPAADQITAMETDNAPQSPEIAASEIEASPSPPPPPARKARQRRAAVQSRFKSFDVSPDSDDEDEVIPATDTRSQPAESQGMFMTQPSDANPTIQAASPRKRPADIMDLVAPNAARNKRQRIERGESPLPTTAAAAAAAAAAAVHTPTPKPEPVAPAPTKKGRAATTAAAGAARKGKKATTAAAAAAGSGDELDAMIERGQEEEAARRADDELLRRQLDGGEIDFGGIRAATAVQAMPIRRPPRPAAAAEDHDAVAAAAQRWSPHWNGLTNFKKFRPQGEADSARFARAAPRRIVSVVAVRAKEYGIGDEYWLQDGGKNQKTKGGSRGGGTQAQSQGKSQRAKMSVVISDEEEEEEEEEEEGDENDASLPDIVDVPQARSRKGKAAERQGTQTQQTQAQTQTQIQMRTHTTRPPPTRTKRGAPAEPLEAETPAKKRATRASKQRSAVVEDSEDSEESEDEEEEGIGFRFGKRR